MGEKPEIVYRRAPGATPEAERAALAAVYTFVLERHKRVAPVGLDGETLSLQPGSRREARRAYGDHDVYAFDLRPEFDGPPQLRNQSRVPGEELAKCAAPG